MEDPGKAVRATSATELVLEVRGVRKQFVAGKADDPGLAQRQPERASRPGNGVDRSGRSRQDDADANVA